MKNRDPFLLLKIIVFTSLLLTQVQLLAQDKNVLAQSQYYKAEEAYNEGNYTDVLKYLYKAERYAGNNHLIQYLKVKSLYMNKDFEEAKRALSIFFNIIDPSLHNTSQYREMVLMVAEIDEAEKIAEQELQLRKQEEKILNEGISKLKIYFISIHSEVKNNDSYQANILMNSILSLFNSLFEAVSDESVLKLFWNQEIHELREILRSSTFLFDERDWTFYKTVIIGNTMWMAENLKYKVQESHARQEKNEAYFSFGRYYEWGVIKDICPQGWHIPSGVDWFALRKSLGGGSKAGIALKSTNGWIKNGNGTNTSGFNWLPVGVHSYDDKFYSIGSKSILWSTAVTTKEGWHLLPELNYDSKKMKIEPWSKPYNLPCRCIKD